MASYPSGLRDRFAKPPFAGSNPADASNLRPNWDYDQQASSCYKIIIARVMELVDMTDLKSVGWISRAGSSPASGTAKVGIYFWMKNPP